MGFDISKFAESLNMRSDSDHREQIVYLNIDELESDEKNFYTLTGIEDLANNIRVCGLQQPIRVRKEAEDRYTIVSGHRRRAALEQLIKDGFEEYQTVPCIVEEDDVSDAMRELRLIYANSATRQLTSAELMQQAERVTELLYKLKEEGVEFPGRMRDQVAAACKTTSTKLAELKVIREKLTFDLKTKFITNEINARAAYGLARLPEDIQKDVCQAIGAKGKVSGSAAENLLEKAAGYYTFAAKQICPATACQCHNVQGFLKKTAKAQYSWDRCEGNRCCMECHQLGSCTGACKEAKAQKKDDDLHKKRAEETRKKNDQRRRQNSIQRAAERLVKAADAAGLADSEKIPAEYGYQKRTVGELRKWAAGEFGDAYFYSDDTVTPREHSAIVEMAKKLKCSTDYILGATDELAPALPEGQLMICGWMPGGTTPKEPCMCAVLVDLGRDELYRTYYRWSGKAWTFDDIDEPVSIDPTAWLALPEYKR